MFRTIRKTRGFEEIADQIEAAISSGQLPNGERLPNENELAASFGVSRATLREAFRALEAHGFVEVRRGAQGGTFVSEPGYGQVTKALQALLKFHGATARDLGEVRASFEPETAFWAAERASDEDVATLLDIADKYTAATKVDQPSWSELVEIDLAFHEHVALASKNQVRIAVTMAMQGALEEASLGIADNASDEGFLKREAQELRGIARAIAKRDAVRARTLMRRHIKWNTELEESASA